MSDHADTDLTDLHGEAEMLRAENELQRYWVPTGGGIEPHGAGLLYRRQDVDIVLSAIATERDALRAEVEQLRIDAERYRYLRERDLDTISSGGVFAGMTPRNFVLNGEDLDHAVDAALKGASHG